MQGHVDTSFQTMQRDLFESGLVARIGVNAFGVWLAIKSHADFNTGVAWPGMRRLATMTGLSLGSVSYAVKALVSAKLLRVLVVAKGKSRRGNTYIARERMDVRLGERVLCTIVVDYVPAKLRLQLRDIDSALKTGKGAKEALAECEIIPGEGFVWDPRAGSLRGRVDAVDVPAAELTEEQRNSPLVRRLMQIQQRVRDGG